MTQAGLTCNISRGTPNHSTEHLTSARCAEEWLFYILLYNLTILQALQSNSLWSFHSHFIHLTSNSPFYYTDSTHQFTFICNIWILTDESHWWITYHVLCAYPAQRRPKSTALFLTNIDLVKLSKEMCNLGSYTVLTIKTNNQVDCNIVLVPT